MSERTLDVICLGRAAVDLYGQQRGSRLEDVQTFAKYLGGSSANVAVGLARLGSRSSMLTRVGNEQMGAFVKATLEAAGVDVGHVVVDPDRLTGLVLLGIAGPDSFPHVFFRERCADMGLCVADVEESHVASSRMLAITGTHLSTPPTAEAVQAAVAFARRNGTRVVLDVDYRPVLWNLVTAGEGENRYVASRAVTEAIATLLPSCDIVVGTEEEIRVAGGAAATEEAIARIRANATATIVVKRGAAGCTILPAEGGTIDVPGFPVHVLNTLGAGDGFLAGFLHGVLSGWDWRTCGRVGNACGALTVSRHGCAPALPSRVEIDDYLGRPKPPLRPDHDARLRHLHLASTTHRPTADLCILAFDHRRQLEQLAGDCGQPFDRIRVFKGLVADAVERVAVRAVRPECIGVIVDDRYGEEVLSRMSGAGRWIGRAVEVPGSRPVEFEGRAPGDLGLLGWPSRHVIKCLVFYHPDDDLALRLAQERRIVELWRETVALERELLLELVLSGGDRVVDDRTAARALQRFYNLGVRPAWWKLEPPSRTAWPLVEAAIENGDPLCHGVLLLGLDAPEADLRVAFEGAASFRRCRGFAVGRSIFGAAARDWMRGDIDDAAVVRDVATRYENLIDAWHGLRA
jgi:5-dehydro-2-deoxygluconokinase